MEAHLDTVVENILINGLPSILLEAALALAAFSHWFVIQVDANSLRKSSEDEDVDRNNLGFLLRLFLNNLRVEIRAKGAFTSSGTSSDTLHILATRSVAS